MKETFAAYSARAIEEFGPMKPRQIRYFRKYSEIAMSSWPMALLWYVYGARCGSGDAIYHAVAQFCKRKDAGKYLSLEKES